VKMETNKGRKKGHIVTKRTRNKIRKSLLGKNWYDKGSAWKGGKTLRRGYVAIKNHTHPFRNRDNYILEHRLVMEKQLGRYLKPEERVHHIDGDKSNNVIDNLHLFHNESKHQKYHQFLKGCIELMVEG